MNKRLLAETPDQRFKIYQYFPLGALTDRYEVVVDGELKQPNMTAEECIRYLVHTKK